MVPESVDEKRHVSLSSWVVVNIAEGVPFILDSLPLSFRSLPMT